MHKDALLKAIHYFGSQQALAKVMCLTPQTVNHWLNCEQKIPDAYAWQLFIETKGYISLKELKLSHQTMYQMLDKMHFFSKFPAISVPIKSIQIGKNFVCPKHKDGDSALMNSRDSFLSEPVLIDSHHQLIACECRLRANRLSGKSTILAYQVHLPDVIKGNFPLASLIQFFPLSEKTVIGLAIGRELGNRQGQRKDLNPQDDYPEITLGTETRYLAATLVGFESDSLYRQVKVILEKGLPSLIHAMDEEKCSVSEAKKIALLPQKKQRVLLKKLLNQEK